MYLKNNFQTKVVVAIIMLAAIFIFNNLNKKKFPSEEDFFQKLVVKFYLMEFEGVVTKRFVDKKNHGYRKVVFRSMNKEDILFLNFENDYIFYSFNVGDTIVKKTNTLNFLIKTNSEEIFKKFNFDNYVNRDDYDENLDSIIFDFLKKKSDGMDL